jgi:hypothetical protein
MPYQFSTAARNASLDAIEATIGVSPTLRIRSGDVPADCAAARTGTVLATMALPSDFMAAASAGLKGLSGTWQDAAADAAGIAGHFEIVQGATCHIQGRVSQPWAGSTAFLVGQQVHANGNVYRATVAGTSSSTAPSHTTGTATDGGVTWQFVQVGTDMEIQNTSIALGQQITVTAFNITSGGA